MTKTAAMTSVDRTLLLTDVVDSTALVERIGDEAAAALWTRHDALARDLLAVHSGREIDKTDGLLALFDAPGAALDYAAAYHRGLAELSVEVGQRFAARIGIHHGSMVLRENPAHQVALGAKPLEVDGLAKPLAARLMGLADGEQTLVSPWAQAELTDVERRSGLISHGHYQLKGVAAPVEVFEAPGGPGRPPPDRQKAWRVVEVTHGWQPLAEIPESLPRERDAFVGREAPLRELAALVDGGAPLVSIVGPGGCGKTRISRRYAWTWLGSWPGGAWFCDLSEASDIDGICAAMVRGLRAKVGGGDPVQQIGAAIAQLGRCLVVLDNFEQVVQDAPATVGKWLEAAPDARFLVSTREPLHVSGEHQLTLETMSAAGRLDDGVDLFIARARQVRSGFEPNAAERADIARLVEVLDGLPLAIELAAARSKTLKPAKLLERMTRRFDVLRSRRRDAPERQSTLWHAIDWSWQLLEPWQRATLAQLGVFEGGFDLAAAEAVVDLALWPDAPYVDEIVEELVERSVLRVVGDAPRFGLLTSVQAFALEKLAEETEGTRARHASWFSRFGQDAALDALDGMGGMELRLELADEVQNLELAARFGAVDEGAAALCAIWTALKLTGPPTRFGPMVDALLARGKPSPRWQVRLEASRGISALYSGDPRQAVERFHRGLEMGRRLGDKWVERLIERHFGDLCRRLGRLAESREHYAASMRLARELGDKRSEATGLLLIANLDRTFAQFDQAEKISQEGLDKAVAIGDERMVAWAWGERAYIALRLGQLDLAWERASIAVGPARRLNEMLLLGWLLGNLALVAIQREDLETADSLLIEANEVLEKVDDAVRLGWVLGCRGELAWRTGDLQTAADFLARGEHLLRSRRYHLQLAQLLGRRGLVDLARGERAVAAEALREGRELADRVGLVPESVANRQLQILADALAAEN